MARSLGLIGLGLLSGVACAPPDAVEGNGTGDDGLPRLTIVYPADGDVVPIERAVNQAGDPILQVRFFTAVYVENFELVREEDAEGPVAGQGHFHIDLNSRPGPYGYVFGNEVFLRNVEPGDLVKMEAYLVGNDHIPLTEGQVRGVVELTAGELPPLEEEDSGDTDAE